MKRQAIILGSTLISGVIVGLVVAAKLNITPIVESQSKNLEVQPQAFSSNFTDAVENVAATVGKAVVSISTEHTTKISGRRYYFSQPFGGTPFGEDDAFRKFFDDFFSEIPDREFKQMGLGSGVIINADGYVLTNEHVIGDADKINVTLSDGRVFKAELKGRDPRADLAVIKINAGSLPLAVLGDSDNLKIGQWVVAIGNPFGFALTNPEPTVTAGVISALHRTLGRGISSDKDYNDLIQTDAAINPGNSGGPLVNLKGEIVGINVAIFSTSGGYQGVGFAIPASNAKRIIGRLIEGKKIAYGWLGVTIQDLTDDLVKFFNLPDKKGVLVAKVLEDSPAQKGGIKESDIIKEIDERQVNNVRELLNIVGKSEAGKKSKLKVIRGKKELVLDVTIGERPQNIEEGLVEPAVAVGWRGLRVGEEKQGVIITDIAPLSPADESGLNSGDVIQGINRQPIKSLADYESATKGLSGDALVHTGRGYFVIKEK
ncbi:MAG: Do family serine endopeptidase [Candidatus Omnitrophota bacterium]